MERGSPKREAATASTASSEWRQPYLERYHLTVFLIPSSIDTWVGGESGGGSSNNGEGHWLVLSRHEKAFQGAPEGRSQGAGATWSGLHRLLVRRLAAYPRTDGRSAEREDKEGGSVVLVVACG